MNTTLLGTHLLNTTLLLTLNSLDEHHSSVNTPLKTTHLLIHLLNTPPLLMPVEHHLSVDTPVEYHSSVDTPVELIALMLTVPVDHAILLM